MTSTALLYDCFSGICGDMHIGAMVDLGVPVEWLSAELGKLELAGEFTLRVAQADKMGITGTRATVDVDPSVAKPVRRLADIKQIISTADYPPDVERLAIRIFEEIGVAEAKIHGTTVEQIHFHEVGATDSIVDIVAAAICLNYLNVETILCGTVEVGGGMVKCAHGILPVPAPATAEILLGIPLHYGRVDSEATTPTGAAILKSVVDEFAIPDRFVANKIGYGIGRKDFEIPNVLRVVLGEVPAAAAPSRIEKETNVLIECNIDDMSPEAFQPLMENLLDKGAKDVFMTPIVMKKSRPATKVSVLVAPDQVEVVAEVLFTSSTTIGLRTSQVSKLMLPREAREIPTRYGVVKIKLVTLPNGSVRWKSEHEDVMRLANEHGIEYLEMKVALDAEIKTRLAAP